MKNKYVKVWVHKRKNPPKKNGKQSVSYSLEWVQYGRRQFQSLGRHATAEFARTAAGFKEQELNGSIGDALDFKPISWGDFKTKYLDTFYPGHEFPRAKRDMSKWGKSASSLWSEKTVMNHMASICNPPFPHEVTSADREKYITARLSAVSPESVDSELRALRLIFNVAEDWGHRRKGSNPFAGRGAAKVGGRRRRAHDDSKPEEERATKKPKHFSQEQIRAILAQADNEALTATSEQRFKARRLRALIYFEAYTGARSGEALHLEWTDVNLETGIALVHYKREHGLKTETSDAPVGLSDKLIEVLRDWKTDKQCRWVFPNQALNPWTGGRPGHKPLEQFKELAERAGVKYGTLKMFRHTLSTLGKSVFGLSPTQVKDFLRHGSEKTQEAYTHKDPAALRDMANKIDF